MKKNKKGISEEEKEAIERSGYLMEQKIAKVLKQENFIVLPNYSFQDIETGSSKEIDIIAILFDDILTDDGYYMGYIYFYLVLEVKNIKPVICFTQYYTYDLGSIFHHYSGVPKLIWTKRNKSKGLLDFLEVKKFHHYYNFDRIATQFCTIKRIKSGVKELIASHHFGHNRNLYNELVLPLIKVIEFEKEQNKDILAYCQNGPINLTFYYPITVVNEIIECNVSKKEPEYKKVNNINFIRRYESKKISGIYKIDICDEKGLENIIKTIKNEFMITKKHIENNSNGYVNSASKEIENKRKEKDLKNTESNKKN